MPWTLDMLNVHGEWLVETRRSPSPLAVAIDNKSTENEAITCMFDFIFIVGVNKHRYTVCPMCFQRELVVRITN